MYTWLSESCSLNVLELQPTLLFKERQPSPRYSQRQPSGSVPWNSCSITFHKILRKPSVVERCSSLKLKKIYTPTNYSFRNFSNFWAKDFYNFLAIASAEQKTFKKQPSEGVPWNSCSEIWEKYQETIHHKVFC